nr:immunoglobulin heavy chain junction region [Macaca mulatta]MPN83389.1 immunoglobulin heavy chain junction region [Macaca mulatta]MPN83436.1 immunoglobulin heavy chain junction region [Macaca mulatta]MPN83443.1 immunoglobulin heavy chain junction region [Macaca mulatta]MPN83453.1 immunoglobulin heavy chain junction region [Macaca mulatta]
VAVAPGPYYGLDSW